MVPVGDPVVGPPDQPVPAGHDEPRRGERDLAELGMAARVLAPQAADDVDGLLGRGGELQTRVDRGAGVEPQVLGGEPAAQAPGEHLGDQCGCGAAGLLAAQPARHGCLVVAQVETVLQAELVDSAGQSGVGEPRLRDERGELAVGRALRRSFRHQLCGLLPWAGGRPSGPRGTVRSAPSPQRNSWRPGIASSGRSQALRTAGRTQRHAASRLPAFIRSCDGRRRSCTQRARPPISSRGPSGRVRSANGCRRAPPYSGWARCAR